VPETPIVEMRGIEKSFGAVRALSDVNLVLYPGEILGLVGDNSAGKSTLMKILTGAYQRDAGEILVAGKPVHFRSPHESRSAGIEMIYQDFALCGNMDVGQNIFLGRWPRRGPFVDRRRMYAEADTVLKRLKVDVNSVYQKVESLSGGRQQSVAIARAISFEPRVVILDEPTANLSVMATERLLETMLELKRQGVAQIIISHRLVDIFAVGDRVMVLKRGENVGDRHIQRTDEHEVLQIIVSGTRDTARTADMALRREPAAASPTRSSTERPRCPLPPRSVSPVALFAVHHFPCRLLRRPSARSPMSQFLDACSALPEAQFADGDCLIAEGSPGGTLYVLISGEVVVLKGETEVARVAEPGAVFGEISALLGIPTSASVRALGPVRAYRAENAAEFIASTPAVALQTARILAQRLNAATAYLADVKAQFADQQNHFAMVDRVLDSLMQRQASRAAAPRRTADPRL
jgi:simple sugar transport system ATP-binding protein